MLRKVALAAMVFIAAGCQSAAPPDASLSSDTVGPSSYQHGLAPRTDPRFAAIVIDAETGRTLYAENADAPRYPASLTKMMTLYVLFEEIESGRLQGESELVVSANAAAQPASKLGLRVGSTIRVEDAVRAIAVRSSNDVATVIAENISGSEAAFAARMTRTAQAIGLSRTTFRNASGLPDPGQRTTARDMAELGMALQRRFPRYSGYFSLREFSYAGRNYESTNELLGRVRGMDGMKTGYTRASGYNLVGSVRRDGRHVIAVVMGERTSASRNALVASLIEQHMERGGWRTAFR